MDSISSLEAVCKHLRSESAPEMQAMRKSKQRLSSENYRLRKQVAMLRCQLEIERDLARRLQLLLCRAASRLETIARGISNLFQ
jgi:hypothetical protein